MQARQAIRPHYGVLCALYVTVDPTRWRVRWFALALLRHRAPVGCLLRLLRRAVAFEQRTDANRSKYEPTCTSSCLEPPLFDCRFFSVCNCELRHPLGCIEPAHGCVLVYSHFTKVCREELLFLSSARHGYELCQRPPPASLHHVLIILFVTKLLSTNTETEHLPLSLPIQVVHLK